MRSGVLFVLLLLGGCVERRPPVTAESAPAAGSDANCCPSAGGLYTELRPLRGRFILGRVIRAELDNTGALLRADTLHG